MEAEKAAAGIYQKYPERVAEVFEKLIRTQDPDWNDEVEFLVDTGATYLVLNICKGGV